VISFYPLIILICCFLFVSFLSLHISYGSGHGANWHPSVGLHLLRGEFIAWTYSLALYEAIDMVIEDSKTKSVKDMERSNSFDSSFFLF
jgi:hypothetical protein